MSLYSFLQKIWHYFKCVIITKSEIGILQKKKFFCFGKDSIINRPCLQLSGLDKVSIGNGTTILQGCRLAVFGDSDRKRPSILVGDGCYIGFNNTILSSADGSVTIGNNVIFASNILVTNENHRIDPESTIPYMDQELSFSNVEIGDGCWIGEKVCILSGVTIGKKCVIGAGSVVTKSIPDYCIAVGNPAKVIKKYDFAKHQWEKV